MGPERRIERRFAEYVKKRGGLCIKLRGATGLPDRMVLTRFGGKPFFVEFKSDTGRLTEAQKHWMAVFSQFGLTVIVRRSFEDAADTYADAERTANGLRA